MDFAIVIFYGQNSMASTFWKYSWSRLMNHTSCHTEALWMQLVPTALRNRAHYIYSRNIVFRHFSRRYFTQRLRYNGRRQITITTFCICYNFINLNFHYQYKEYEQFQFVPIL